MHTNNKFVHAGSEPSTRYSHPKSFCKITKLCFDEEGLKFHLLPVRSMRQGYAFVSVGMCVCVCVCGQKTRLFTSHRSKISTKTLSAASSLNL